MDVSSASSAVGAVSLQLGQQVALQAVQQAAQQEMAIVAALAGGGSVVSAPASGAGGLVDIVA